VTRQLIITGDDFGLAVPVNEAVERAFRDGVLRTTSLMIGAPAARDAIERARRNPDLRVGLHVAVCEGRPVLPAESVPGLVNSRGELHSPAVAVLRYFLQPGLRQQLEAEMRAQFEAFRATGLELDHVNGHNNMQLHPVVLPILLRLAREYGARAMRLPYEPFAPSFCAAWPSLALRLLGIVVLRPWAARVRQRAAGAGLHMNDYLFGMYDCGRLDTEWFVRLIERLPDGVSEIHCHPATRRCAEIDRTMPTYGHERELLALLSPRVRAALVARHLTPLSGFDAVSLHGS
jgi:hopanoid biosynthesis associated protein HpnK